MYAIKSYLTDVDPQSMTPTKFKLLEKKYTERADMNAPSLVYRLLTCVGRLRRDGQCCGREAQCDRQTKINWTKTAHRTYTNTSNVC